MSTSAARSCPPAGSWIRRHCDRHGWATARWHLFTGDADWHPEWPGPSLETACGYRTGALSPLWTLNVAFGEPAAPCRKCQRVRVAGPRIQAPRRSARSI